MKVSASVTKLSGRPIEEIPTKNRRERKLAIDDFTAAILRAQIDEVERRAEFAQGELVENPYVFTDAADGSEPWKPDTVSQYFRSIAAKHYSGRVTETDRALAAAVASLIAPPAAKS